MDNYRGFAGMYDEFMTNAPYNVWGDYIDSMLKKYLHDKDVPLVLDLACGTGAMTIILSEKGYDMIGVDSSVDMLASAQQKVDGHKILFLAQDMRKLDLYGTIDAAVCVCDGLNYILEPAELLTVFKRVKLFLNPGGVFIFDMNTEYKFKEQLGQHSFEAESKNGAVYEWDNFYDENTQINEYSLVFYKQGKEADAFTEKHKQRAYSTQDITKMLTNAGFTKVHVTHEYTNEPPRQDSLRLTFVGEV